MVLRLDNPFQQPVTAIHRAEMRAIFHYGVCEARPDYVPRNHDRSCRQGYLRRLVLRELIGGLNYAQQGLLAGLMTADLLLVYANAP